ncbi:MliC family protein [Neisseria iguanae]|nr:MliC family protein [Neisseria iguanae]
MKLKAFFFAAATLTLAACASDDHSLHHAHDHGHTHHHEEIQNKHAKQNLFQCENGMAVYVAYLGNEKIRLNVDNDSAVLKLARSGSGELYTGNTGLWGGGARWHQKGGEAYFGYKDAQGNSGETVCRA